MQCGCIEHIRGLVNDNLILSSVQRVYRENMNAASSGIAVSGVAVHRTDGKLEEH